MKFSNCGAIREGFPRNPSRPPFFKGRRAFLIDGDKRNRNSPFKKGGSRGISGGPGKFGTLFPYT
jgi:hypothetical protein